ncbi:MAG: ribonuclease J [Alphaproteobacteria bacterium]|nr:ribonuclease J [Alphaproteobacteria bacterium]
MAESELLFVPLGGAGEIGMNLNLYGYNDRWLMIDCGVSFGDETTPGIELLVPDPAAIVERKDRLEAIVITHAHEDHIGAVAWLWSRLKKPVYATPFAAGLLRRKLGEVGLADAVPIHEIRPGRAHKLGPFSFRLIAAAHSIPEGNFVAIATPAGTILHATDWKLDPTPLVGPPTDETALRALGDKGVLALVCDSTNVFVEGRAGSEGALRDSLIELVGRFRNRVVITAFASNIARVETMARAAAANGRHLALVGRSLDQYTTTARETGYLADFPDFIDEAEAGFLPPEATLLAVTGSQGEPRSALARIAADDHPHVSLEPGDTVIFSSRVIPGNEKAIGRVQNHLARLGVEVITDADHFVHVSGHPARDELAELYRWTRPRVLVPIHGETRHLAEHARFAAECGIAETPMVENGAILRLAPGAPEIVGHVETGRLALDGKRLVPVGGGMMRDRHRLGVTGTVLVTVVFDKKGRLVADPQVSAPGLLEPDDPALDVLVDQTAAALRALGAEFRRDDEEVEETVRLAVRGWLKNNAGKRPPAHVHIVRV